MEQVGSVDELRELLHDGASDDVRRGRLASLAERSPDSLNRVHQDPKSVLHRVSAYLYADEPLDARDRARIVHLFPMHVRVIALADKTLGPGQVWDLGTSTSPVVVTLGTLTMEPGSSIVIRNTALKFTVENLVRNSSVGAAGTNYDIAILGVQGPAGSPGQLGGKGGNGDQGKPGTCTGGGGISGDDGGPGSPGTKGAVGGKGGRGLDGLESLSATISITNNITASQFVIMTQSGFGGTGGTGGSGGQGGSGGNGGGGATCGCEHTNGGSGGQGGPGGDGGDGGEGGDGALGMDSYVTVPIGQKKLIVPNRLDAPPGEGGPGGASGAGGTGGSGGGGGGASGCPHGSRGGQGGSGATGNAGNQGLRGRKSGPAGQIYVNER